MLNDWLTRCDVRDEHGRSAHLTPHQWRHTFATRLINKDVPQGVMQVLLDHESSQITAQYARITNQTVRRRWAQATNVNSRGELVSLDPGVDTTRPGPVGQDPIRHGDPDPSPRLLRDASAEVLPARERVPDLPVFMTDPEFLLELRGNWSRCRG